jgi:hypothetical protein
MGRAPKVCFDTNLFVKRVKDAGLTTETASQLSFLLNGTLSNSMEEISSSVVTRSDLNKVCISPFSLRRQELCDLSVELSKLKSELQSRQNQTLQSGKSSMEKLLGDLRTNRQRSRDTLSAIRSEMRLEVNLERGRQRDAALVAALRFQDLKTRVDAEVGNAHAALAKLRHDIFYSLTGFLFTSVAALFGFLRLTS